MDELADPNIPSYTRMSRQLQWIKNIYVEPIYVAVPSKLWYYEKISNNCVDDTLVPSFNVENFISLVMKN